MHPPLVGLESGSGFGLSTSIGAIDTLAQSARQVRYLQAFESTLTIGAPVAALKSVANGSNRQLFLLTCLKRPRNNDEVIACSAAVLATIESPTAMGSKQRYHSVYLYASV